MTRTASCACGKLRLRVEGEPVFVAACSCTQCQKRTGSPFGVSSYFKNDQVPSIEGAHKAFARSSDSGRKLESHFCPDCGSSVFWYAERLPDMIGIGVGFFADPAFPKPAFSVWEATKHPWVGLPPDVQHFEHGRG
jgi:hypothetical protein